MGCASFTEFIVAMVQTPSDGTWQPMENSPPGIHTIPFGALGGGGVWLGTVGAKCELLVTGITSPAAATDKSPTAFRASVVRRQRLRYSSFAISSHLSFWITRKYLKIGERSKLIPVGSWE